MMGFQSTRPVWGATLTFLACRASITISIHAPRVGRDLHVLRAVIDVLAISIHAPRVGRDTHVVPSSSSPHNFNPRAPCGARPILAPHRGQ